MRNLLEIARVLTRKKIAKIEILDEQVLKQKDSKFGKFYEGLLTGKIENDHDAAALLYDNSDPGDAKYRQLKSRFRRRLLNTLFFVDINTPLASSYDQAYFNLNKEWSLVEILLTYNATTAAAGLCRQILTTALKFNFTELIVKAARQLREQAVLETDEKAFAIQNALVQQYMPILEAEVKAEQYSMEVREIYHRAVHPQNSVHEIERLANCLVHLSEKPGSPKIQYHMFEVWTLYYEVTHDYEGVLEVCHNAINYLQAQEDLFSDKKKLVFAGKMLAAYLHLNEYEAGKTHAEQTLSKLTEDIPEWIDFMEIYMLLSLRNNHIIHSIAIFNKVTGSAAFKNLEEDYREKWDLFEATLHYLIEKNGTNPLLLPRQRRKGFKLSDFITRPVHYPPRLASLAIQRLTLQILFLWQRRSYTGISERIEQLRKLAKYELKKEGYERAYAFVKLLSTVEKADFQFKKAKNLEKTLQQLHELPYTYRGRIWELEVLPYEKWWELCSKYVN
jgi:hypothetical protein